MSRFSLSTFAALVSMMAFPTVAMSAQVERAALDTASTSSSSTSASYDASASSAIAAPPAQLPHDSVGGARPFSGLGVAVKFGVAGVGFDVSTPLVQRYLNLRGGASFLTYSPSTITTDSMNINGQIKFQNSGIMVDYFPFHGRFRISGGATVYNNTGLSATLSVPTGQSFSVGDTDYYSDPSDPIKGTGTFTFGDNKIAPRVTIGTGNMLSKKGRFTFQSEIGFQYFSAPQVNYSITGSGCQNDTAGVYTNCGPIPQSNISDEQVKLQNDLSDLRFFPIVSFGLGFRIH